MFRPTYYYMAADVIIVVILLLRDILLLLYCLAATLFLPLTWRILMFGCQFQLYLPVEGGKLGLQSSFFHVLPAISCNCGISRSSTSFFSSYCLIIAGMRSNALRKFTAAAWVSAIAR